MGVGEGEGPPGFGKFHQKKVVCLVSSGKRQISLLPPLEKFWKIPLWPPLEKILSMPMRIVLYFFHASGTRCMPPKKRISWGKLIVCEEYEQNHKGKYLRML